MAYIPTTEEQEKQQQEQGMNILAQPGMAQTPSQSEQTPPAQTQTGGAIIQTGQQTSRPKQPTGSGLFTNLKKYVSANRGAGQNIGGAIQQQTGEQAQSIAQNIAQQKQQLSQKVQEGQQKIQGAQQFGQQALQQAGTGQLQDNDFTRFQQLKTGQQRFDEVAPLTFTQQQSQIQDLQRQASVAGTEQGREALLEQTFGQGRQYTAGQKRLDSLLFGTDRTAQEAAVSQLRDLATQQSRGLQEAQKSTRENVYNLREAQRGLQEKLRTGLEGAFTGVRQGLESRAEAYDKGMQQLAQNVAQGLREGTIYEEDVAQIMDDGGQYLRSLAGEYTGLGEGANVDEILGNLSARNLLGQTVGDEVVYNDPDLQRLALAQEVARQRALERLGGISEAERTFLVGPEDLTGTLQVGQYRGEDIGLTGDGGATSFQQAYQDRMAEIGSEIDTAAKRADDIYYEDLGGATGYGYGPARGTRDAAALAREVIDQDTQILGTDERLLDLYRTKGLTPGAIGQESIEEVYSDIIPIQQEHSDLLMKGYAGNLTSDEEARLNELQQIINTDEDYRGYSDSLAQTAIAQRFLNEVDARREAIQAMRSGRFKLGRRT